MLRNPILRSILISTAFALVFAHGISYAKEMVFQREYNYQASEADSKITSRVMALQQVKRLLLEELGTYIASRTEIKNLQLDHDKLLALTAGVVRTVIIDEKWDGRNYCLKAKITADPDEVARSVRELQKDYEKSSELVNSKKKDDRALAEAEALKKEVVTTGDIEKQKKYTSAVKVFQAVRLYNDGNAEYDKGNYREAEFLYSQAIEADPDDKQYYYNRGLARDKQNKYYEAIEDYSRAIELAEKYDKILTNIPHYGVEDSNKAAIAGEDTMGASYTNRGRIYIQLKDYHKAIRDYDKSIAINPKNPIPYYGLGYAHSKLGNLAVAIETWKIGARLGNANAQHSLRWRGISW